MSLPLAGTRVLELTHVWSGPLCGQILADLGAEVIRVESRSHLDIHRRGGPYPDNIPGINRSGTWNAQNRGKRGCTLDLKSGEGKALFLQLSARSDVVIENFTPGTLAKLGLGFETLKDGNPRILLLSLSGYGQTGPHRDSLAYGPMMDAAIGISAATTYEDGIPRAANGWAADVGGALYGCAAIARALLEQPRSARHLDVSQFEAGVLFLTGPLLGALNGNAAPERPVIRAAAPTREPDRWIAVSAGTLEELTALFDMIAGPQSTTGLMRRLHANGVAECSVEVQTSFERWARTHQADEALARLQAAGVPAVPITRIADLLGDPELAVRQAWSEVEHAECGSTCSYGPAIRLTDANGSRPLNNRAAPLLGGDNDHVYGDILGLPAERLKDLAARKII
ncbi:MAG: CoA transferase [Betaproteobacteria bacterium]|nr:CoA transferase [Betaproteobacteria bacterium]